MKINFIGNPQSFTNYIIQQHAKERRFKQDELDRTLSVYSRKYLGDQNLFLHYFQELKPQLRITKMEYNFHPKLLITSIDEVNQIIAILGKKYDLATNSFFDIEGLQFIFGDIQTNTTVREDIKDTLGFTPANRDGFGYIAVDNEVLSALADQPNGQKILSLLYDNIFIANHDWFHGKAQGYNEIQESGLFLDELKNRTKIKNYEYMSLLTHFALFKKIYNEFPFLKAEIRERWQTYKSLVERLDIDVSLKNYLISLYLYFVSRVIDLRSIDTEEYIIHYAEKVKDMAYPGSTDILSINKNLVINTHELLKKGHKVA